MDLVPHKVVKVMRKAGKLAGQINMAADFDETPEEVIAAFEGRSA